MWSLRCTGTSRTGLCRLRVTTAAVKGPDPPQCVPDSLNLGWREELSKSAQYSLWRSPRRALDQHPGFWADSAGGNPRDNRRSISSNLPHKKRTGRTASIRRLRASPPRAVEAPEPQVVVVRPPRARRVEDRVGGVDPGHAVHAASVPVRVVLEREPSVCRTDLGLGRRRRHSQRRVVRGCARKVDGPRRPRF